MGDPKPGDLERMQRANAARLTDQELEAALTATLERPQNPLRARWAAVLQREITRRRNGGGAHEG
jgi:hypothetical protein